MSLPKAVVFDLGKVLLDFDYAVAARKLAERGKLPSADISSLIDQAPLLLRFETGLLTSDEFCREVSAAIGFNGAPDEFATCFADIFTPIEPMIELHAELGRRGFRTFIFSNTNDLSIRFIRRAFPFFANFDGYILSYEHRLMKPDRRLYEIVERETGRRGQDILYLDDRPENIATGVLLGWQAILHQSFAGTLRTMAGLGLLDG